MPTIKGADIARQALREIGVLDPIEAGHAELIEDTLIVGTNMLDSWRVEKLTIGGMTRSVHSLAANTQAYTIGPTGAFDQPFPSDIERWSVIPDGGAAEPVEIDKGRPYTFEEWQSVQVKSQRAAYPQVMYWDRKYSSGFGTLSFHPIPDNNAVDVALYCSVPDIISLVAQTTYDLPPGVTLAVILNLAIMLANGRHGREVSDKLERAAARSKGLVKSGNIIPRKARMSPEYAIGARASRYNLRTGS